MVGLLSKKGNDKMTNVFDDSDFGDFSAKIEKVDAVYKISWTDGVANEWEEFYPSLELATGRLSVLVKSAESGSFFSSTPEEFAKTFEQFLRGELV
jgi:hypothetical protein